MKKSSTLQMGYTPFGEKLPHLTGETQENSILVEKFLGGQKNNQLLNATPYFGGIDSHIE